MEKAKKPEKISISMDNFSSTANLTSNQILQSTLSLDVKGVGNEKDDLYNPFDHRNVDHPNSDFGSLVHLLKASLGSGILAMPMAFKNAGIVVGIIGTIIIGLVCTHCVHILVIISREVCKVAKEPSMTFAETCGAAFRYGPKRLQSWSRGIQTFVDWALVGTYIGANCVYVVLIADSFHEVVSFYFKEDNWDIKVYCAMLLIPLVLLGQIRNLKFLVPFSLMANSFLLVTLAIVFYYIFQDIPPVDDKQLSGTFTQFPLFVSTVIFAMEGIGVVMPVENDMRNPSHFLGCPGVLNIAMSFVVSLYAIVGLFGYLRFGDEVKGSITATLNAEEIPAQVAKVLIGLAILFTYGLQFYVPMDIIFQKLDKKVPERYINITHVALRTVCVAFTVAVAIAVPRLEILISLVGAIFFSTLGLLVPAVVESVHLWERDLGKANWKLYKNILIGLFSILALVSGSYASILSFFEEE